MEEYSPKFLKVLDKYGYSSESLPARLPKELKKEIKDLEKVLDTYEVPAQKSSSKIMNDMLEQVEAIDEALSLALVDFIESQEDIEDEEARQREQEKFLTPKDLLAILEKGIISQINRNELRKYGIDEKTLKADRIKIKDFVLERKKEVYTIKTAAKK